MKHHNAAEATREAAAKVADRRANYAFSNCDRMGGTDPETGVAECSLESRGQDCRCQQTAEDAENMAAAIRALPLPVVPKADAGWLIEREGPLWWAAGPSSRWNWQQAIIAPELWTADANKAVRFARKQDAETVIFFEGFRNVKATEHGWLLLTTTEPEEWRPIETAPKDGEPVLIACDRTGSIRWAVWSGGMWRDGQVVAGGRVSGVPNPTHWQPLPLPPTPTEPK